MILFKIGGIQGWATSLLEGLFCFERWLESWEIVAAVSVRGCSGSWSCARGERRRENTGETDESRVGADEHQVAVDDPRSVLRPAGLRLGRQAPRRTRRHSLRARARAAGRTRSRGSSINGGAMSGPQGEQEDEQAEGRRTHVGSIDRYVTM